MFQDIFPHHFDIHFIEAKPEKDDYVLKYSGDKVFLTGGLIPQLSDFEYDKEKLYGFTYLFSIDSRRYFLAEEGKRFKDGGEKVEAFSTKEVRNNFHEEEVFAILIGFHLYGWYKNNTYCGRCGAFLTRSNKERAFICPDCGNIIYPRISPVVIVGITDGNRLLMTKYAGRDYGRYALVAGFMEVGETPEDTVKREVYEEVGLHVKNIEYYKSQPWPYPDSLLMGFYAQVDGDTTVELRDGELKEGTWFEREEIPQSESMFALTSELIENFRLNGKK